MHLILTERGNEPFLIQEVQRSFREVHLHTRSPGLVAFEAPLQLEAPPCFVFARQLLPEARPCSAPSISAWVELVQAVLTSELPEEKPWQLQIAPHYSSGEGGHNRCELIRKSLLDVLRRKRRQLVRSLRAVPHVFTPDDSLVQLLLTSPEGGFLSVASAPGPFAWRRVTWPYVKGEIPVASDKAAPSRAFAKLLEAEQRLGRSIAAAETCVDLGASPGSWSYVALARGANVIAVDRAPLRADLMSHPRLTFQQGDAFKFTPGASVDWLLCDVVAAPERSVDLLLHWLREGLTRHFVMTLKFKGQEEYGLVDRLKHALPGLCDDFYLVHLCANKNEVCAFGSRKG